MAGPINNPNSFFGSGTGPGQGLNRQSAPDPGCTGDHDFVSEQDCLDLLIASGCSKKVVAHSHTVRSVVDEYTGDRAVCRGETTCGALLHDIGRSQSHGLDHSIIGGDICRDLGLPENIAQIVERHLGAGQTADECILLGLPPRNCMPETLAEQIVAHADNLVKGDQVMHIEERMMKIVDLPRKKRKRTFRLALLMELFRR